jgi:tetratricopeptide (TPR) repeat protein
MDENTPQFESDRTTAWWRWFARRAVLIPLAAIVVVSVGLWVFTSINNNMGQSDVTVKDQKTLEANLAVAKTTANNPKGIITLIDRLITGEKDGMFVFNDQELAQLHLDRAAAYMNLNDYEKAIADYQQAATINEPSKIAALQGEVEARYKQGQRKELIPVYNDLITVTRRSENPMRNSAIAQYQANIEALQNNQEISF